MSTKPGEVQSKAGEMGYSEAYDLIKLHCNEVSTEAVIK